MFYKLAAEAQVLMVVQWPWQRGEAAPKVPPAAGCRERRLYLVLRLLLAEILSWPEVGVSIEIRDTNIHQKTVFEGL